MSSRRRSPLVVTVQECRRQLAGLIAAIAFTVLLLTLAAAADLGRWFA